MNNEHLKLLAEGVKDIPDDQEIITTGKEFKKMMLGFIEFSDNLLDSQKWLYEFIYGLRKQEQPNPFYGAGSTDDIIGGGESD